MRVLALPCCVPALLCLAAGLAGCRADRCKGAAPAAEIDIALDEALLAAALHSARIALTINGIPKGERTFSRDDLPFVLRFSDDETRAPRELLIDAVALGADGAAIGHGVLSTRFSADACNFFTVSVRAGTPPGDGGVGDGPSPDGAEPLPCDPGFSFNPAAPETGKLLAITYETTVEGYPFAHVAATGPGAGRLVGFQILSGTKPWVWMYVYALDAGGTWQFVFQAYDPPQPIARCEVVVRDTGPPPAECAGKVCGEPNGAGGTCTTCPMVGDEGGACLDPPSPIGPSGPDTWACLDRAACTSRGECRIWCPSEPCDGVLHPEGCPQGVEACFVDPHLTDYEEACRQCCNSRYHEPTGAYACWDDAFNICRYPGDCGKPYPLP